jgi:hypothetical protein
VSQWPDLSSNSADLTTDNGSPTFNAASSSGISGLPTVETTDTGDRLRALFDSQNSEPYSVYVLGRGTNRSTGTPQTIWSDDPTPGTGFVGFEWDRGDGVSEWKINGVRDLPLNYTNDLNPGIFSCLFDGGDGTLRVNGTQRATKNADSDLNVFDGLSVGQRTDGAAASNFEFAEILVYDADTTGFVDEIEQHLDRDTALI